MNRRQQLKKLQQHEITAIAERTSPGQQQLVGELQQNGMTILLKGTLKDFSHRPCNAMPMLEVEWWRQTPGGKLAFVLDDLFSNENRDAQAHLLLYIFVLPFRMCIRDSV